MTKRNPYLLLTRKLGESIEIAIPNSSGTDTKIYLDVNKLCRSQVKLGFEAPKHVSINRLELLEE